MAEPDKRPVTMEELLISSLAQTDALAKLLIEKGLITREELKISEERAPAKMAAFTRLMLDNLADWRVFQSVSSLRNRTEKRVPPHVAVELVRPK